MQVDSTDNAGFLTIFNALQLQLRIYTVKTYWKCNVFVPVAGCKGTDSVAELCCFRYI